MVDNLNELVAAVKRVVSNAAIGSERCSERNAYEVVGVCKGVFANLGNSVGDYDGNEIGFSEYGLGDFIGRALVVIGEYYVSGSSYVVNDENGRACVDKSEVSDILKRACARGNDSRILSNVAVCGAVSGYRD